MAFMRSHDGSFGQSLNSLNSTAFHHAWLLVSFRGLGLGDFRKQFRRVPIHDFVPERRRMLCVEHAQRFVIIAMESPLNLAHLQDRRAESFLRHSKFAEAITCHEKASEYLLEAMKMTQVTQALVSMKLQYTSHLRQQRVLKDKWKRYELQIKANEERTQKLKEQESEGEMNCTLNQLNPCSLVISAENFSVSSISSCEESGRDECDSANARIHELQMQVLSLNQALEDSNRENAKLKRTIISIKEFVEKTFGYVLDEEKFLEEQIESSALKTPDDSRFESNDIDIHTCTGVQSSSAAVIGGNPDSAGDPHCHNVGCMT